MKPPSSDGLTPPEGYTSWLDYAVATMDTRTPYLEYLWNQQPGRPEDVMSDDLRAAARVELARLRMAPWAACPGVECIDGTWCFTGTTVPVADLFGALGGGSIMVEEWHCYCAPGVTKEQIEAVFSYVCEGLKPKAR